MFYLSQFARMQKLCHYILLKQTKKLKEKIYFSYINILTSITGFADKLNTCSCDEFSLYIPS
jgi:hypothetical protein